jgi:UDP-glucose 4-epimerase
VVRAYEQASRRSVPYAFAARRPGDIDACFADPALARERLGWTAQHDLQRMCADSWRWQSNNPRGFEA